MEKLDLSTHIPSGIKTIEASAGTGKTFAIMFLFLKALVQLWESKKEFHLKNILVVTFTEAATKELRFRILDVLKQFVLWNESGALQTGKTADFESYFEKMIPDKNTRNSFCNDLKKELHQPDEISVFTIHGFCSNIIAEFPFECGIAGDFNLIPDLSDYVEDEIYDYWRKIIRSEQAFDHLIEKAFLSPERIKEHFAKNIISSIPIKSKGLGKIAITERYGIIIKGRQDFLDKYDKEAIEKHIHYLFNSGFVDGRSYRKNKIFTEIDSLHFWLEESLLKLENDEKLSKLCWTQIELKPGKNAHQPFDSEAQEFFEDFETIYNHFSEFLTNIKEVKTIALAEIQQQWQQRKKRESLFSYDDLLLIVRDTLRQNNPLVQKLAKSYPFGFIDEFQDTDPVQFEIFDTIFSKSVQKPGGFYMIGDPKQSIYSFRNADLNTYIKAREQSEQILFLNTNYRSINQVVESVNRFFSGVVNPFRNEKIQFENVSSIKEGRLLFRDEELKPFWVIQSTEEDLKNKKRVEAEAIETLVEVIQFYLSGEVSFEDASGTKRINPADIAVLVPANHLAHSVYRKLSSEQIPAAIYSKVSVFTQDEAHFLAILLDAILHPTRLPTVRSALLTPLFPFSVHDFEQWRTDDSKFALLQEQFLLARQIWYKKGFSAAISFILNQYDCQSHLLAYADGERSITNLNHLIEWLGKTERENFHNPEKLFRQYQEKIREARGKENNRPDDELLRLESDDNKVRIVTIHSSKGLEYPIVIQPFAWEQKKTSPKKIKNQLVSVVPNDQTEGNHLISIYQDHWEELNRLTVDEFVLDQRNEEAMRMFYVALTRAKWQNVLLFYPGFEQEQANTSQSALTLWARSGKENSSAVNFLDVYHDFSELHSDYFGYNSLIPELSFQKQESVVPDEIELTKRKRTVLNPVFYVSSYSSIVKGSELELSDKLDELDDDDGLEEMEIPVQLDLLQADWMRVKAGNEIGNVLHNSLEKIFTSDKTEIKKVIANEIDSLAYHSLFDTQIDVITQWIHQIYTQPMNISEGLQIRLSDLERHQQKRELEFLLSSKGFDLHKLSELLMIPPLASKWIEGGFIKGFMDLLFVHEGKFYLLDYKTNFLGTEMQHYLPESLKSVMQEEHYTIQMVIYTLALHTYLKQTVIDYSYEMHFGGMLYWFVRGLNAPSGGLYYHKIPMKQLEQIEALICGDKND